MFSGIFNFFLALQVDGQLLRLVYWDNFLVQQESLCYITHIITILGKKVDRVIKWRKIWISWGCSYGFGDVVVSKFGWVILGTFCPWGSSIGPLFWFFGFGGFGSTKRSSIFEVWFLSFMNDKRSSWFVVSISKLWWMILKSSSSWGSYASPLVWTLWIYWEYVFTKNFLKFLFLSWEEWVWSHFLGVHFYALFWTFWGFGVGMNEIQDLSIVISFYLYLRTFLFVFGGAGVRMNEIQDLGILLF
jgi:hypothetical protein